MTLTQRLATWREAKEQVRNGNMSHIGWQWESDYNRRFYGSITAHYTPEMFLIGISGEMERNWGQRHGAWWNLDFGAGPFAISLTLNKHSAEDWRELQGAAMQRAIDRALRNAEVTMLRVREQVSGHGR